MSDDDDNEAVGEHECDGCSRCAFTVPPPRDWARLQGITTPVMKGPDGEAFILLLANVDHPEHGEKSLALVLNGDDVNQLGLELLTAIRFIRSGTMVDIAEEMRSAMGVTKDRMN